MLKNSEASRLGFPYEGERKPVVYSPSRRQFLSRLSGLVAAILATMTVKLPSPGRAAEGDKEGTTGGVNLGKLGAFAYLDSLTGAQTVEFAQKVEQLGYRVLWFPEAFGRDPFAIASHLLSNTKTLILATGIANIWKREPVAMMGAARTLAELFPGRFILGLGVSGGPFMARHGLPYERPYSHMREYLAKMKTATYMAPPPQQAPPIILAALLPKMLQLAAAETRGTVTAFVPPEHIAKMRAAVRLETWICAQQVVMLETDATTARTAARAFLQTYLSSPNYQKNFRLMGFQDADLAAGGSDRFVDAIVAWGNEDTLRERIAAHYQAGATQVLLSALRSAGGLQPDLHVLQALAPR
jgi:probable F420-dependent oxidoreductase